MTHREKQTVRDGLGRREILASAIGILASQKLWSAETAKFRIIAEGLLAPESPKPLADGSTLVVEMARGTLSRVMPNGKVNVVADLGPSPNGCALGPDGAVYVANNGGLKFERQGELLVLAARSPTDPPKRMATIQRVDLKTGAFKKLYGEVDGVPLPGVNDLVFDRHGGFYISGGGSVHWAKADGSLIRKLASVPRSNGIILSPDHLHLYVAAGTELIAFDVIGEGRLAVGPDGLAKPRVLAQIQAGSFDSMAAEADGGMVVGTLAPGALSGFTADGKLRDHVPVPPEQFITSVGFGGRDLKTAYATLTQTGKLAAVEWPRPGLRLANQ